MRPTFRSVAFITLALTLIACDDFKHADGQVVTETGRPAPGATVILMIGSVAEGGRSDSAGKFNVAMTDGGNGAKKIFACKAHAYSDTVSYRAHDTSGIRLVLREGGPSSDLCNAYGPGKSKPR